MRAKAQELLCSHFGITFPYVKMGKIDSLDLFGLDTEMPLFALYQHNQNRWMKAADIGANLGLHSILMGKLGWDVWAYEPDPQHFEHLEKNIKANNLMRRVTPSMVAVHNGFGTRKFVRVMDNQTASHIEGFKNSYGPVHEIQVKAIDATVIWPLIDFAKLDCEGAEADICETITNINGLDLVMEVGNVHNAQRIYEHFQSIDAPMWAQKKEWQRVKSFADMPINRQEGSLFVGLEGPWA